MSRCRAFALIEQALITINRRTCFPEPRVHIGPDNNINTPEHDTVNRLDDERLKEWMDGVREGMKNKVWADLFAMTHRM